MYDFSFVKPGTVADAVTALASEDAQALGGLMSAPHHEAAFGQPNKTGEPRRYCRYERR